LIGTILFGLAVLHTFSTKYFERLAHTHTRHAGLWHLLGQVEVVFGFWAMVLMLFMFAIMVIATLPPTLAFRLPDNPVSHHLPESAHENLRH